MEWFRRARWIGAVLVVMLVGAGCGDVTAPSVPNGVSASASSCATVTMTWSAANDTGGSGLSGYNVKRGSVFMFVAAPATSLNDTGLAAATAYSYTVTAIDNANNQSAPSGAAGATTPACGPTAAVGEGIRRVAG